MSNLLDSASIVLTPTAYDNGRMLSVKPNTDLLGAELLTQPVNLVTDFSINTFGTVIVDADTFTTSGGTFDGIRKLSLLTVGKKYRLVIEGDTTSSGFTLGSNAASGNEYGIGFGTHYFTAVINSNLWVRQQTSGTTNITSFSIKEDLSGDFDFSRNSAATRVNAQGLVENVQILSGDLVSNGDFSQEGVQEVSNGSFSQEGAELISAASWSNQTSGTATISNGVITFVNGTGYLAQGVISANKFYKFVVTLSNVTQGSFNITTEGGVNIETLSTNGVHEFYLQSTSAGGVFIIPQSNFTGSIDNVSVKEVGQDWSLQDGWSIAEAKAVSDGTVNKGVIQENIFTIGKTYKITFDVDVTSGTLSSRIRFKNDFSATTIANISSSGSYTFYQEADRTGLQYITLSDNAATSSITNISVKEVGQDWIINSSDANNYVEFGDGTARLKFLNTSPITEFFTSTNLMIGGKTYQLTVDIAEATSGSIKIDGGGISQQVFNTAGINTRIISPTSNTNIKFYRASANVDITLNSVSLIEITDDTNLPRINYEGFSYQDSLGSELVTNGDFATDSANWFLTGTSFWVNSSIEVPTGGLTQSFTLENNKTYKITFDVIQGSGINGGVYVNTNYNSPVFADNVGITTTGVGGTYTFTFTMNGSGNGITLTRRVNNQDIRIDNVSIKEVLGQEVVPDSGCGSWLLEPQSTNLLPYSEDFSNSAWTKTRCTIDAGGHTSPSGENNAFKMTATDDDARLQDGGEPTGVIYTQSIYVKSATGSDVDGQIDFTGTQIVTFTATEQWQRVVTTSDNTRTGRVRVRITNSGDELLIWGAQLEQQSYSTSYIPTNGAASTRLQDIANNSGNATLINSTEGVLYAEAIAIDPSYASIISLSDGTNTNRIALTLPQNVNNINAFSSVNGVKIDNNILHDPSVNSKYAIVWNGNSFKVFVNGIKKVDNTMSGSFSANALTNVRFDRGDGGLNFHGKAKALVVYKEALTDEQLTCLTTI